MKEMDLLRAMTDLDDELLDRESGAKFRRFPVMKFVALAAALALMTVCVFAATGGVQYWFGSRTMNVMEDGLDYGYYGDGGDIQFDTVTYSRPFAPVTLDEAVYEKLEQVLLDEWEYCMSEAEAGRFDYSEGDDFYYYTNSTRFEDERKVKAQMFDSVDEVEEYLGIDLDLSPEIKEAAAANQQWNNSNPITIGIWSGGTYADARQELEETGTIKPAYVVIFFRLNEQRAGEEISCAFGIPLTQEFIADHGQITIPSFEKEGEVWGETVEVDGRTVTLFGNNPEEGYNGFCYAVFGVDGIEYTFKVEDWDGDGDPKAIVMKLLESL